MERLQVATAAGPGHVTFQFPAPNRGQEEDGRATESSTHLNGEIGSPSVPRPRRVSSILREDRTDGSITSTESFTFSDLRRTLSIMTTPERPVGHGPTVIRSIRNILTISWFNVLLTCVPISWALHFSEQDQSTSIFIFSFLSIMPLAKLLTFTTDELSMRVGPSLAGLMNATLGNAVQLIFSVLALIQCQLHIVQATLVGSILCYLLFVLGMSFLVGGRYFSEQGFPYIMSQTSASLLSINVIAVLVPSTFHLAQSVDTAGSSSSNQSQRDDVLRVGRGVSVILMFLYVAYLMFLLLSHRELHEDHPDSLYRAETIQYAPNINRHRFSLWKSRRHASLLESTTTVEEEEVEPSMNLITSIAALTIVTAIVAVTGEWLVESIDGLTKSGNITKEFIGIILIPVVGNTAVLEHLVTLTKKDELMLNLSVAIGSSIQMGLSVIPFMIILAWILGKPLSLLFDPLEAISMFLGVLTLNYVLQDGKTNWLEGIILVSLYVIVAVIFWFYPGGYDPLGFAASCV